jgi:hypothetical protein
MIVVMKANTPTEEIEKMAGKLKEMGFTPHTSQGGKITSYLD